MWKMPFSTQSRKDSPIWTIFNLTSANAFCLDQSKNLLYSKKSRKILLYYIPSSEILEFPGVINFDIITSDDINFHVHFLS